MFYDNYLKLCNSVGKSPSAVAITIGIEKSTVTRWKKGGKPVDATTLKIADYFGVSVDYLLNGDGDDEWTELFRSNLAKEIEKAKIQSIGANEKDEIERIAYSKLPLTFEKACAIAEKLGTSVEYLLRKSDSNADDKKSPLTEDRQGELMNVLRDIGALNNDGLLSDSGLRTVTDLLRNNAEMLKHFINEDK